MEITLQYNGRRPDAPYAKLKRDGINKPFGFEIGNASNLDKQSIPTSKIELTYPKSDLESTVGSILTAIQISWAISRSTASFYKI